MVNLKLLHPIGKSHYSDSIASYQFTSIILSHMFRLLHNTIILLLMLTLFLCRFFVVILGCWYLITRWSWYNMHRKEMFQQLVVINFIWGVGGMVIYICWRCQFQCCCIFLTCGCTCHVLWACRILMLLYYIANLNRYVDV